MPGYKLNVHEKTIPLVDRFYCPLCQFILKEAVQTPEGDRLCYSCVLLWNIKGNFPVLQWFPDKGIRKEVNRLPVYCQNRCLGCKWIGVLSDHESFHKNQCDYRQTSFVVCSAAQSLGTSNILQHDCEKKSSRSSIAVPYNSSTIVKTVDTSNCDQLWIVLNCTADLAAIGHCIYGVQFIVFYDEKVILQVECVLKTWRVPVFFLSQLSMKRDASTECLISNYLQNVFNGPSLIECRLLPLLKLAVARDESVCVYSTPASSNQTIRNTFQVNEDKLHLMTASSSDDNLLDQDDSLLSQLVSGIQSGMQDLMLSSFFSSILLRAESSDEEGKPHNAVCRFDRAEYMVYIDGEKDLTVATASIGVKDTTTMLSEYLPTSKSKEAEAVYAYECDVEYASNNDQNYEFVVQ